MHNYKEIFNTNYPNGSTVYNDLDGAVASLIGEGLTTEQISEQLAYFIAIGLERIKSQLTSGVGPIVFKGIGM